jgi:hypothetical protein
MLPNMAVVSGWRNKISVSVSVSFDFVTTNTLFNDAPSRGSDFAGKQMQELVSSFSQRQVPQIFERKSGKTRCLKQKNLFCLVTK